MSRTLTVFCFTRQYKKLEQENHISVISRGLSSSPLKAVHDDKGNSKNRKIRKEVQNIAPQTHSH